MYDRMAYGRCAVTHRKYRQSSLCVKIPVKCTHTHGPSSVSVSGIVKNDELKWSRRHTIDTIPDDWRQKTYSKMEQKNRHLLLSAAAGTAVAPEWIQTIYQKKKKTEFYLLFVQLHSCASCAF